MILVQLNSHPTPMMVRPHPTARSRIGNLSSVQMVCIFLPYSPREVESSKVWDEGFKLFPYGLTCVSCLWVPEHLIQDEMVRSEVSRFSPYSLAPIHHWVTYLLPMYLGFLILEYTLVTVLM